MKCPKCKYPKMKVNVELQIYFCEKCKYKIKWSGNKNIGNEDVLFY